MNIMHRISVIAAIMMEVMSSCSVKTVDVAFGPNVKDYTPVVVDILKEHPKGDVKIRFGKGLYPFYPEQGAEESLTLSNNDSGDKRIAFLIKEMKNVTIEGNGADFLFHGCMVPFAVKNSSNVTIKGVSVDYDYPWTFEGTVLSNDPVARSFTVKVLPDTKYRIEGDRLFSEAMTGNMRWGRAFCLTRRPTGRSSTPAPTTTAIGRARWEPGISATVWSSSPA